MPSVNINGLDLDKSESLLVSYHCPSGMWFASVGDLNEDESREMETGATAEEALGRLFLTLSANMTGTS